MKGREILVSLIMMTVAQGSMRWWTANTQTGARFKAYLQNWNVSTGRGILTAFWVFICFGIIVFGIAYIEQLVKGQ